MLLWLICAVITAALVYVLVRPLASPPQPDGIKPPEFHIYRDQLAEIEADAARGLIGKQEAQAARTEVSRRLLAAEAKSQEFARSGPAASIAPYVMRGLPIALPLTALGLYLVLGSPGMPGQPFASRSVEKSADRPSIDGLVEQVEKRLAEKPDDGQGWDVIAPIYMRQNRHDDAAHAYRRAIALLGETPKRLSGLGEALIFSAGGAVGAEARSVWTRVAGLEPGMPEPKFWLALAKEQDGRLAEAVAEYRQLVSSAPADARWRAGVEQRLALIEARLKDTQATSVPPAKKGPSESEVAAAQAMSPAERTRMVEQMVAGLAERLQKEGRDVSGWEQLIRSYMVLGRRPDAERALSDARRSLAGDAPGMARIDALAQNLGLGT